MWLHKKKRRGVRSSVEAAMRKLWLYHRQTVPFLLLLLLFFFFFFKFSPFPFLILIKGPVQDKQCLPTLQFKQRGPQRREQRFLNVHWQLGLIYALSRWSRTCIYLLWFGTPVGRWSCCLAFRRHACLKGEDRFSSATLLLHLCSGAVGLVQSISAAAGNPVIVWSVVNSWEIFTI